MASSADDAEIPNELNRLRRVLERQLVGQKCGNVGVSRHGKIGSHLLFHLARPMGGGV
jgi:hypothetical protein